jgi:hypothetical protein
MHRTVRAAVVAAALLVIVGVAGLALAACGGSSVADAQTSAAPAGMPQANG